MVADTSTDMLDRQLEPVGRLAQGTARLADCAVGEGMSPHVYEEPSVTGQPMSLWAALLNRAARRRHEAVRPLRVLVVDDEEPIRKFVERVLRDAGYETMTAGDGPEAIDVAGKGPSIDLLLTDVMMPQMAGDELARRLRQHEPGLRVLYLTGFSDSLFKERLSLWQDEAFLDKPCTVKGLLQAVSLLTSGQLTTTVGAGAERARVQPAA